MVLKSGLWYHYYGGIYFKYLGIYIATVKPSLSYKY